MSRHGVTWEVVPAPPGRLFEGPQWIAEARSFQWVDILGATIHRWSPYEAAASETRETGLEFATVALPLDADRMVVASRSSLHLYSWQDRTLETVGQWEFPDDVRFNDGAISPTGDVYVGTMSMQRRTDAAALHRVDLASGSLTTVVDGIGISNGLSWDSSTSAYYVDSLVPQIDRLRLEGDHVSRSPWLRLADDHEPDGLTVTPWGDVAVALWGDNKIVLASPGSRLTSDVALPARFPTSVKFGGDAAEFVVVTTAEEGVAPESPGGRLFLALSEDLRAMRPQM